MNSHWTPLWSDIITSSVWGESKEVKILWITMLAAKNRNGMVRVSVPGLARMAVLTEEEVDAALKVLMAPDKRSYSADNDGRRIERKEDGWLILNHRKYIDRMKERNEYQRIYQNNMYRKKHACKKCGEIGHLKKDCPKNVKQNKNLGTGDGQSRAGESAYIKAVKEVGQDYADANFGGEHSLPEHLRDGGKCDPVNVSDEETAIDNV